MSDWDLFSLCSSPQNYKKHCPSVLKINELLVFWGMVPWSYIFRYVWCHCLVVEWSKQQTIQAWIQRGAGGPDSTPPPLRFVWGGSCVEALMDRRGGPMVVYLIIILTLYVYILPSSMFSMELSFFFYVSLIQILKRIQLPIPCFKKRAFSYFSSLELHNFTPCKPKIL